MQFKGETLAHLILKITYAQHIYDTHTTHMTHTYTPQFRNFSFSILLIQKLRLIGE